MKVFAAKVVAVLKKSKLDEDAFSLLCHHRTLFPIQTLNRRVYENGTMRPKKMMQRRDKASLIT
jgi:hypothetical protein